VVFFSPNQITNFMEQSPSWEADSHSASQEIPCLLWNTKVHYRVHKTPPLVPILSHMNPIHTFPPNSPKIDSNIILQCLPIGFFSSGFPTKTLYVCTSHLSHACYIFAHPSMRQYYKIFHGRSFPHTSKFISNTSHYHSTLYNIHRWPKK
jgi:hypothetical protein